jgi:hypothetical protein
VAVLASEEAAHRSCCIGTDKARADTVTLARTEGIENQVGLRTRMFAEEEKRWRSAPSAGEDPPRESALRVPWQARAEQAQTPSAAHTLRRIIPVTAAMSMNKADVVMSPQAAGCVDLYDRCKGRRGGCVPAVCL